MTIVQFTTHLTTNPVYSDEGVSFKVIFGERPTFCFTNRIDVVSCLIGMGLSMGDSIEMTATMLNMDKGFNETETTLKVMEIELLETYFMCRKRKREEEAREELLSALNNKKRKGDCGSPIVEDMSLCSTEESTNSSTGIIRYDIHEYEGDFMHYYEGLRDSINRYQSQLTGLEMEENKKKGKELMDRLWHLFSAIQALSGSDELVVITRFVDVVKQIVTAMHSSASNYSDDKSRPTMLNILLPTYIFNRFMENRK